VLDCIGECGSDDVCQESCYGAASPEGFRLYETMMRCWSEQCGAFAGDPEAFDVCVRQACGDETGACEGHRLDGDEQ